MLVQGEGTNIIHLQSLASWEFWGTAPESSGSCLGHCLEYTAHAVAALTKSPYFKGNLALWATGQPGDLMAL